MVVNVNTLFSIVIHLLIIIVICIFQVVPSEVHFFLLLQDEVSQLIIAKTFFNVSSPSLGFKMLPSIEYAVWGCLGWRYLIAHLVMVVLSLAESPGEFGSPVTLELLLFLNIHFRTRLIYLFMYM